MAANNIRAGGAFVEMFVKDGTVSKTLDKVRRQLTNFGSSVRSIGLSSIGLGSAIGIPLAATTASFAAAGANIDDMSQRTGIATDALQELAYAAGQSGTDMESLEKSIGKMQRTIADAQNGSLSASDALNQLGLSASQLAALSGEDQIGAIADKIASIQDPAQRTAAAMSIFGKSGAQLLPLLNEGASGIAKMRAEAHRLGLVLDQEAIRNAAVLDDNIARLSMSFVALKNQIGAALSGGAIGLTEWMRATIGYASKWVSENKSVVVSVASIAAGLAIAGTIIAAAGTAFILAGVAVGGLSYAITTLGATLTALAGSPVVIVLAGIVAITAAVPAMRDAFMESVGSISEAFSALLGTANETINGIIDAMSSGNVALAAKVLWAGVKAAWLQGTAGIRTVWREAVSGLAMVGIDAFSGLQAAWARVLQFIGDSWEVVAGGMGGVWSDIQDSIASGFVNVIGNVMGKSQAEINDMQQSLKEEQAAQKQASAARMQMRSDETTKRLKEIAQQQADSKDEISQELLRQNNEAAMELQNAVNELKSAREQASAEKSALRKDNKPQIPSRVMSDIFTGSIGTFSAAAAQQSRSGGLSQLQTAAERTADATEDLADRAKSGGIVFA